MCSLVKRPLARHIIYVVGFPVFKTYTFCMKLTTTNILHAELLQAAKQVNHSVQKKKYYPAIGEITLQLAG